MEICPKCHQLMTWYMTYNSGNPYCGYHCNNCGYDTMNNTHTVTTSKTISINNQPKPIIQKVVQVSDDSINKIADAVVRKLTDRKTEPQIDDFFREPTAEERKAVADYIDSISVPTGVNVFDFMDEPTISKMEQVDKDINIRSKDEPKTQMKTQNSNLTFETDECAKEYEELGLKELKELINADRKTEPTISKMEQVGKDEPQTERSE